MKKSGFVDALGWGFLLCSCLMLLLTVGYAVLYHTVLVDLGFEEKMMMAVTQEIETKSVAALMVQLLKQHVLIVWVSVIWALLSGIASWFLMQRKTWAKKLFVFLLLIDVVWMALSMLINAWMALSGATQAFTAELMQLDDSFFADGSFQQTQLFTMALSSISHVLLMLLLVWIAWKLHRPRISAEFR